MHNHTLHVVTMVSNPIRWESRYKLARQAILGWIEEPEIHVTLVEVAHGDRNYELADLGDHPKITHIPLRQHTLAWCKESALNIGIARLPRDAKYVGTFDADIHFRKRGWAAETIRALQIYPVVQPFKNCYDLGPDDDHIQTHKSFASQWHKGDPVVAKNAHWWDFGGGKPGPYIYPHSGFLWCWVLEILEKIGGLFEYGAMGSGDHHQALGLIGAADYSITNGIGQEYRNLVKTWEARALVHVNKKIGYVPNTVEHFYHGDKNRRQYVNRWQMFIRHKFNPLTDLKRNRDGLIEFSGNKPALELEFDNYLRNRREDDNCLG
jgi:hypothetical protein